MTPLLEVKDLRTEFRSGGSVFAAVDGVSFSLAPRRDAGHRGRIGLRQVSDVAVDHAPGAQPARPHRRRRDQARRPQSPRPARERDARRARRCRVDDLPGADDQPQSGADRGRADHRGDPPAPTGQCRRGARPRPRDAAAGQDPLARDAARRVSAPALGRHAPARHDRHGAGLRSQDPDRRRADHGARRHHPGADPRPAARPARAHGHGHHADHPRSRRGGRARASRHRHVCRPHRRGGAGRPAVRRPAASLYARPPGLDPAAGQRRRRAADRHRGRRAQSLRPAAGLPLQPALPTGRRALQGRAACPARDHARAIAPPAGRRPSSFPFLPPPRHERSASLRLRPHQALPGEARHRLPECRGNGARRRRPHLRRGAGRDAGAGGRIGLRQVDDRPHGAAPDRGHLRHHPLRRPRRARPRSRRAARPAPRHADHLPGSRTPR